MLTITVSYAAGASLVLSGPQAPGTVSDAPERVPEHVTCVACFAMLLLS